MQGGATAIRAQRRFRENIMANRCERAHGEAMHNFSAGAVAAKHDEIAAPRSSTMEMISIGSVDLSDAQRIDASTPNE